MAGFQVSPEARANAIRALTVDPRNPQARAILARALLGTKDADLSLPLLRTALKFAQLGFAPLSTLADLHALEAIASLELRKFSRCEAAIRTVLIIDPTHDSVHWTQCQLTFQRDGMTPKAWQLLESRWAVFYTDERFIASNQMWDGSRLDGRRILLAAEGGLGDTVQFVRYAELVKARGGNVVLAVPPALVELMRSAPGVDQIVAQPRGKAVPDEYDLAVPLYSLPRVFGTTEQTAAPRSPYLSVPAERIERWRSRIPRDRLNVGIVWSTSTLHRSLPLVEFAPLASIPGVRLYSLQRGLAAEQLKGASFEVVNLEDGPADLLETGAAMMNLDLIISPDTMTAHLAGALGRPTWLALLYCPEWRWLQVDRSDTPWYPTMRLFRQQAPGDWASVVAAMAEELRRLAAGSAPLSLRMLGGPVQ